MTTVTFIRFVLRLEEPGGVLTPGPVRKHELNMVPDRGPTGEPQIPGASLAGALRDLIRTYSDKERAKALFGYLTEKGARQDTVDAVASPIWVFSARPTTDQIHLVRRASTAIDRHRGAARASTLRTEQLLATGSCFDVYLRWDDAAQADLDLVLTLLLSWRPLLGHGVSRGRGRCVVESVRWGGLDLTKPSDLLTWLTTSGPRLVAKVATRPASPAAGVVPGASADQPVAMLPMSVCGPLRVGNGETMESPDGREIAAILDEGGPLVPGSSLKGLTRSRAEFILRSVGGIACADQRCGRCHICHLFGYGGGHHDRLSVGGRGRVRFRDAAVKRATDGMPMSTSTRTHVSIDRFTGGVAWQSPDPISAATSDHNGGPTGHGLLYTVQTLEAGEFTVEVESIDLTEDDRADLRALLRLIAEDLNDGLIGVGGGTARGYGSVKVDCASLPVMDQARRRLADMLTRAPEGSDNDD